MRIFAAVVPDDDAVAHLEAFLEPRRAAADFRRAPAEQRHVTLAFVGSADEWRVDAWAERLTDSLAEVAPAEVSLAGCVAFPDPFGTRVLAMGLTGGGVEGDGLLPRLATKARSAASRSGLEVDGQRFRPHCTVARMRRPTPTTPWVRLLDDYAGPAWTVDAVHLVASHLGEGPRGRPRHETVAVLPLGTASRR